MQLISENDLFYLRIAAHAWLKQNKKNPNATNVLRALINTQGEPAKDATNTPKK